MFELRNEAKGCPEFFSYLLQSCSDLVPELVPNLVPEEISELSRKTNNFEANQQLGTSGTRINLLIIKNNKEV